MTSPFPWWKVRMGGGILALSGCRQPRCVRKDDRLFLKFPSMRVLVEVGLLHSWRFGYLGCHLQVPNWRIPQVLLSKDVLLLSPVGCLGRHNSLSTGGSTFLLVF